MGGEELAPLVIQQHAVGLQRIDDAHARRAIFLLITDSLPEEVQPHQHRFAALPGEGDFRDMLCFNVLTGIFLKKRLGHAKIAAGVQAFFREEVTVFAVEIADRPTRFGHEVKGGDWIHE